MKHALLLLALPAHAAQISTEVSHMGQPESRWMRSEASMREEDEWRPSAQATFPRPSYGNPSWSPASAWSGNRALPGSLPGPRPAGGPGGYPSPSATSASVPWHQGAGYSGYGYGPAPVQAVPRHGPPAAPSAPSAASAASAAGPVFPKVAVSSAGPNNMKEAEAETKKFFEIEEMVAKETGLPLNSSEAAQKEEEEKAEAKEAEEEEEAERFDALYAGIAVVILLAAGGTFYFHRRSQQKLDKLKPGEVPMATAPPLASPEDPSAPGPAEAEGKAATGS